jgi:hypothetical protein
MAIELSNVTFTNRADVVPVSGAEEILNNGVINTLAGNDIIIGTAGPMEFSSGILNGTPTPAYSSPEFVASIDTGNGNDIITGTASNIQDSFGIFNWGPIVTGNGNDIITGIGSIGIYNYPTYFNYYDENYTKIDTGDGNDIIMGSGPTAISNGGYISTGNGNDSIIAYGSFDNSTDVSLGDGNDSIIVTGDMYSGGYISTGNGNDSIITSGSLKGFGNGVNLEDDNDYFYGFARGYLYGGNGEDTLELPPGSYTIEISFNTVKFTEDSTFTDNLPPQKAIMNTSGFEKLIAGSITYDWASLINGQTILVA